jgi:hypothetical protein
MTKCVSCGGRKANRYCAAIENSICSLCCGTKRQKEIACFAACEYLKKGTEYQLGREITKEISSAFRSEADDVFQLDEVAPFVLPIEGSFVEWFYHNENVNDDQIYDALAKVYANRTGKMASLKATNRCEEIVFEVCQKADNAFPRIPADLKNRAILRILKSIKTSSGGVLGNRNYLEMIYSQFRQDGKWSHLFKDLGKESF